MEVTSFYDFAGRILSHKMYNKMYYLFQYTPPDHVAQGICGGGRKFWYTFPFDCVIITAEMRRAERADCRARKNRHS